MLTLSLLLGLLVSSADGTGYIYGYVQDTYGNPLGCGTVMIVGTSIGAMTDADGYFRIENVPAGEYSVRASMVGCVESTTEGVMVSSGSGTQVNYALSFYGQGEPLIIIKI
jgi:hypothetical protein